MSIEALFDHTVAVYRPTQGRGAYSEVVDTFALVSGGSGLNAAIVPPRLRLQDPGPGETRRGRTEWYLHKALDVAERDVVDVTAGPEAPSRWRVVSTARPRGHHIELVVEPWVGTLPGDS